MIYYACSRNALNCKYHYQALCIQLRIADAFNCLHLLIPASWLNVIQRFFRSSTTNRRGRGVFQDPEPLITEIGNDVDQHTSNSEPFLDEQMTPETAEEVSRVRRTLSEAPSVA